MDVQVVIVNYKTLNLTRNCYDSLRLFYPEVPVLLIDNHSDDGSAEWITQVAKDHFWTVHMLLDENIGHGPALHLAAQFWYDGYLFALDSDCQVFKWGFLEDMSDLLEVGNYAAGEIKFVNERIQHDPGGYPYIHPSRMMVNIELYLRLKPFVNHGGPVARNMIDATKKGYKLAQYPVQDYVFHMEEGTYRTYNVPGKWEW